MTWFPVQNSPCSHRRNSPPQYSQKIWNDGGPIAMVTGFVQLSIALGAVAVVIGGGLELAH